MNQRTLPLLLALLLLLPFFASPVRAAEGTMDAVYTSFQGGNSISSGSGTANDPCNLFVDALAKVKDGGTIYIQGQAFINGDENGKLPFVIGKNVTITSAVEGVRPSLDVRPSGLVLGADVTFQDITLEFASKCHDAIFANGHTLKLINVARGSGTREVDLFAGTLAPLSGDAGYWSGITLPASGACGRIYVEVSDSGVSSEFGNLYGGSMNTSFSGAAEIYVKSVSANALAIGNVYACGALEADYSTMLDTQEPEPPAASASLFPVTGRVDVGLYGALVKRVYGAGAGGGLHIGYEDDGRNYSSSLVLSDMAGLHVVSGKLDLTEGSSFTDESAALRVDSGARLGFSSLDEYYSAGFGDFTGGGVLVLGQYQSLSFSGSVSGTSYVNLGNINADYSGKIPIEGHAYIVASQSGSDAFVLHPPQGWSSDEYFLTRDDSGRWAFGEVSGEEESGVLLASISLPASYTLSDGNVGLSGSEVLIDVEYAYQPDPYTGLNSIPARVTLNAETLTGKDEGFGHDFFPEDASAIEKLHFYMSNDFPEDDLDAPFYEYLWIYPGENGSIPPGTYEIGVTIPGEYMLDEQDESLHFTLIVEESGPPPLPGDMNGDGRLSLGDAIRAARIAAFIDTPTAAQLRADTDENGRITIEDVLYICRSIANIQTTV